MMRARIAQFAIYSAAMSAAVAVGLFLLLGALDQERHADQVGSLTNTGGVGEYFESVVPFGSAVALTTATAKTVTSISLTAGDWDVDCNVAFLPATSTSITALYAGISLANNLLDTTLGRFAGFTMAAVVTGTINSGIPVPPLRFSLSGTTTVFMVAQSSFTVSTMSAYGIIRARRVR
jgi:hypothetical protein